MTERQSQLIEAYIPSPRDESLDFDEYYVKDNIGRIYKVHIRDIYPHGEETLYGVYTDGGRHIKCWCDDIGGYPKRHLYDNKTDCQDDTHSLYDNWETLREIQKQEVTYEDQR